MSARPIGELIAPIAHRAMAVASLQSGLSVLDPSPRKQLVMLWWEHGVITAEEAELLIEHNALEAA